MQYSTTKKNKDLDISKVSLSDLMLFSIYSVLSNNEICSFERLIKECFTSFPKNFGFIRYPLWPDARRLDRPLRALRSKELIRGDSRVEFFLTDKGKQKVDAIRKSLRQGKLL